MQPVEKHFRVGWYLDAPTMEMIRTSDMVDRFLSKVFDQCPSIMDEELESLIETLLQILDLTFKLWTEHHFLSEPQLKQTNHIKMENPDQCLIGSVLDHLAYMPDHVAVLNNTVISSRFDELIKEFSQYLTYMYPDDGYQGLIGNRVHFVKWVHHDMLVFISPGEV